MHSVFLISLINWIPHTCIADGMDNEHWACLANAHFGLKYWFILPLSRLVPSRKELGLWILIFINALCVSYSIVSKNPIWSNLHDYGSSGRRENPHIIIICWAYCAVYKEIRSWKRVCKCSKNSCRDENFINRIRIENWKIVSRTIWATITS